MDESVRKYLEDKYGQRSEDINTGQLFSNLGDVIAGSKVGSGNDYFDKQRKIADEQTYGQYDKEQDREIKGLEYADRLNQARDLLNLRKEQAIRDEQLRRDQMAQNAKQNYSELELKKSLSQQGLAEKQKKDQELSAVQAKQLGLAEMGQLANKQYESAIDKGFDPTSYSPGDYSSQVSWLPEFMKSKSGKEAMSAQSSWIESYLRDASGAAIPPNERGAYAADYFPRPGDTPDIVANKEKLRAQKEKSALVGAGPGAKQFQKIEPAPKVERKVVAGKSYIKVPGGWKKEGE